MTAKEWAENKTFSFRNDLPWTGLDWEEITREMNNRFCKLSTV